MSKRKPIAVLQGASTPEIQDLMRRFAARAGRGARVVGVVEDSTELSGEACGAGRLVSLTDGGVFPIFQDLGAGSEACRLDASGVTAACAAVQRDIAAGCDLVVLSKFAKAEADRGGLGPAFAQALEAQVPILTAVSPRFIEAWGRFAEPLFEMLPAEAAAIDAWWGEVSPRSAAPRPGAPAHR